MNSQREAFEKEFPVSEDTRWCDEQGIYVFKDYDGKYPDPGQNMLYIAWQKGSAWQAATEQGVGEATCSTCGGHGWLGGPSYYEPADPGEQCPDCNTLERQFSTHPLKPTGGGVPEGYTPVKTETLLWLLGEGDNFEPPEWQREKHQRVYGKLGPYWWRTHLRSAALLATQQPPEQDATL